MIDDIAENGGGSVIRTAVGEANVANAMVQNNCIIGGEGNGGVIDLRVGPIRDSLVAMALVLELMADTGKTVSELVAETGGYDMQKTKFTATKEQAQQIIDKAAKLFKDAKIDTTDGCRFDFDDGWLHIRSSNTEPIMRIIVETRDVRISQGYIDKVAEIRKDILT
jgi:phosphomannomutase